MLRTKKEVDRHVKELLAKIKNEHDRKSRGYNIARLYYNVGEFESARRYLAEFIFLRPKSPEAHRLAGEIYEALLQKEKAVYSYKTSYEIADTQKDLILKICELYAEIDNDNSVRLHWAEEGERLFPHHKSIIKLRESLMLNNSNHSKEDLEKLYLQEIKASPVSLSLHLKLLKLYKEWSKEDENKLNDAYYYIVRVESRSLFSHSFEWYHIVWNIIQAYENWKKPYKDKLFEELVLSILDRYVYQSLASCCGSALTAICSINEADEKLQRFDDRLIGALKLIGAESLSGKHMISQYYFHLGTLLAIKAINENIVHKDYLMGVLLMNSCKVTDSFKVPSNSQEIDLIKSFWYNIGCHRVSQSGHILTQLAVSNGGQRKYLDKLKEFSASATTRKTIGNLLFGSNFMEENSFIIQDKHLCKDFSFVNKKILLQCDQDVSISRCGDLRELVWLYLQYDSNVSPATFEMKPMQSFFNFHFFRGVPFSSNINSNAPETLSHLDLVAFIVATAFCQEINSNNCVTDLQLPTVLSLHLHTAEQNEWWSAAAALCSNSSSRKLNRLRSVLQNGLEGIRYLSQQILPLPLAVHLARYFTSCVTKAQDDGNSASEIEALEERAEHYWDKVLNKCKKSGNHSLGSANKSRLFELPRSDISGSQQDDLEEEGQLFIAERLTSKGRRREAIEMLASLKTPRASFKRAMLYKESAKDLIGNCNLNSLSVESKNEYLSLLTQARDTFFLTLDRLKMPGRDASDSLNFELSEELACVERSLASASLDDSICDEPEISVFHPTLELTNGNASSWEAFSSSPLRATSSISKIVRQEARPSPERLDAQLRHLTDIQQNTIKNIEDHNAALRAQNNALLQTCQTMASEFKQNVAFYKSFIEQKNATESFHPIVDHMKELQLGIKRLQTDVRSLASEVADLRSSYSTKTDQLQLPCAAPTTTDNNASLGMSSSAAIQGVYNNYLGFYNQPAVTPNALFPNCQPPFLPPTTHQDQTYLLASPTIMKAEQSLPTSVYSSANYQSVCNSAEGNTLQTLSSIKGIHAAPPHSFQITLPSSAALSTSVNKIDVSLKSSTPVFSTEGLLSTIPAPLYSAVLTHPSHEKAASKNLLISSLNYSPETAHSSIPSSYMTISGPSKALGTGSIIKGLADSNESGDISNISDHYVDDGHDPCPDYKPVIPLPAKVETQTGEEDEIILFEERVKLFRFLDKEWKERGVGFLKVLHNTKHNTVRVLMRRDQTLKICCNHLITTLLELTSMKDNDKVWIWAAQDFADEELKLEKFCCRFKTAEIASAFKIAFNKGKELIQQTNESKKGESKDDHSDVKLHTVNNQLLSELFKPDIGSWTCQVCLLSNKELNTACAACQSPNPAAKSAVSSNDSFAAFKDKKSSLPFKFGIASHSGSIDTEGFNDTDKTQPATVVPSLIFGTSTSTISFGPSSSVTITPATTVAPSLFDKNISDGKFTVDGFTFSTTPKLDSTEEDKTSVTSVPSVEAKKDSIFSNFSFKAPNDTSTPNFSFSLSKSSVIIPSSSGGSISNSGAQLPAIDQPKFLANDDKQGLFDSKNKSLNNADGSKDEIEDYEPQIDFKPVIPMPDLVDVKTGEEDEESLFCERAKLFRYNAVSKEWKERGVGELKVLKNKHSLKVRILMRREQTHKVCANHFITIDMKLSAMANSEKAWVWAANDFADEEVKCEQFAARFKNAELAYEFKAVFEEAQKDCKLSEPPSIKSSDVKVIVANSTPLAEMFKPTAGSWECSGCLVVSGPDVKICPACATPQPGFELPVNSSSSKVSDSTSAFAAKPFPFATSVTSSLFSFSIVTVPSTYTSDTNTTVSSSSISVPNATVPSSSKSDTILIAPSSSTSDHVATLPISSAAYSCITVPSSSTTTTFSFGLPSITTCTTTGLFSCGTTNSISFSNKRDDSSVTRTTTPFSFVWKPASETPSSNEVVNASDQSLPPTEKQEFIFGSPGKYEFSFSGVKSPRSRDISVCESEDGVVAEEEEEDNLYFEPVIPLPEKIEVVTGEEDETALFTHRAKLFRICAGEWKERGLGDVKILQHNKTGKVRILMRREQVLKICLNHNIDRDMEFRVKDDKTFYWVATDFSESEPSKQTFAIRFKTPDISKSFIDIIKSVQFKMGSLCKAEHQLTKSNEPIGSVSSAITSTPTPQQGSLFANMPKSTFGIFGGVTSTSASPKSTFSFGDRFSPSNNKTVLTPDSASTDSIEVLYEKKAHPDLVKKARELKLPDNFYLFEEVEPCRGCIGCDGEDRKSKLSTYTPTLCSGASKDKIDSVKSNLFGSTTSDSIFSNTPRRDQFGSTLSNIFGSTPNEISAHLDSNSSLFGGLSSIPTGTSFAVRPSHSTPLFGDKSSENSSYIFVVNKNTTGIFDAKSMDQSTTLFGSNTVDPTSIFTPQETGNIIGSKTVTTSNLFINSGNSSLVSKSSDIDTTKTSLLSSPASAMSFGDIAKKDALSFKNSSSGDASVWVSKPIFVSGPTNDDDYDPHYEPVIPMPDLVEITTGEEGWQELFSQRAKLYRYDVATKQWKERGIGEFKIQFEPNIKRYRLLQRREQIHKLSCNHYLTTFMELEPMFTSEVAWCWLATDYSEKEGEAMKLAVKFKTKEMALKFQEVFNACKQKLLEDLPSVQRQLSEHADFAAASLSAAIDDSSQQHDDEEEDEDLDSDSEDEDTDDEDDDEPSVLMTEYCTLYKLKNKEWQILGNCEIRIYYDDEAYGARIIATTSDDQKLSDNLISIQTTMFAEGNNEISWNALDELTNPPDSVQLKAKFLSAAAAKNFEEAFHEGKEFAFNSGIEETDIREVPENLLFYGHDPSIE